MDSLMFLFGLIIGSFLNVCIIRLPLKQSLIKPASHCMNCGGILRTWDLIPVISWLWLKGQCRYCGKRISMRYIWVELLTGASFVLLYDKIGLDIELLWAFSLLAFLIVIAGIDYDHQLILDKVMISMAMTGVALSVIYPVPSLDWLDRIYGFLLGGGLILSIVLLSRGGIGIGDLWFSAVLGLWFGGCYILLILFIAFWSGAIVGTLLLVLGLKTRKDYIPFGPFIAGAALLTYLYGDDLMIWYGQFFI